MIQRWMAGATPCQLADASESAKGEQAPQTPLERISRCAVSIVDTLVSLDRSVQEGVVEWLEPVRLEPPEIVLPIKDRRCGDVDPAERVKQWTADQIGDVPQRREETVQAVTLFPREGRRWGTAEQIGDVPQLLEETESGRAASWNSKSRVPRQNWILQCPLVELGLLVPEQRAHPMPASQQS